MVTQNPSNFPEPGPEVIETKSRRSASGAKIPCWTVQNEMRGVLGRVAAGAAGRILDSANPREMRA